MSKLISESAESFTEAVYRLCRQIPEGRVSTYKALAQTLGSKAYRAVGQALRHNPDTTLTPCHRVLTSDGRLHGYAGGKTREKVAEKKRLLRKEGLDFTGDRVSHFSTRFFDAFY